MIIRNCPATKEIENEYRCCTTGSNLKKCENITDCVMKRIVEKCRDSKFYLKHYGHPENDGVKNYTLAKGILNNILDIEECE